MGRKCLGSLISFLSSLATICAGSNPWDWPSSEKAYTFCTHHGLGGGMCPRKGMVLLMKMDIFFSPELLWGFWGWLHSREGLNQDPSSSAVCGTLNGLLASLSMSFYFCKVGMMTTVTVTWVCSGDKGQKILLQPARFVLCWAQRPLSVLVALWSLTCVSWTFFLSSSNMLGFSCHWAFVYTVSFAKNALCTTFSLMLISLIPVRPSDFNSGKS